MVKNGLDYAEQIVMFKDGKEKKISTLGNTNGSNFSSGKSILAWTEVIPDLRWDQKNFSVIKILDARTNEIRQITKQTRYFSPAVSPDDSQIALIETDDINRCSIVVLSGEKWTIEKTLPGFENEYLNNLSYYNDSLLLVTGTDGNGRSLYMVNINTTHWVNLTGKVYHNISQPVGWRNYVLFKSDISSISNIYALHLNTKEIYQVTQSEYGVTTPFVNGDTLFYSNYTSFGYKPVKINLNEKMFFKTDPLIQYPWIDDLKKQEITSGHVSKSNELYKSQPYKKINHLFNLHSWLPFYTNPNFYELSTFEIYPGFILLSQNLLNTTISSLGLSFEKENFYFHPRFTYSGFYPIFDLSAKIGGNKQIFPLPEGISPKDTSGLRSVIQGRIYIPFNLTNGKYSRHIVPSLEADYENNLYYENGITEGLITFTYKMTFSNYLKSSFKDIYPTFGQFVSASFIHTPFGRSQFGTIFHTGASLFFPSIFMHHGLKTSVNFQIENPQRIDYLNAQRYYPYNFTSLPRGYKMKWFSFKAKELIKFSFDYTNPLFYPDLSIPSIIYLKRNSE
ncbi:MAG: hypothetical protein HC906_01360 [Bacteroidales bacterium]|nr:hypothetical protein [Bacteroidales bacterium]